MSIEVNEIEIGGFYKVLKENREYDEGQDRLVLGYTADGLIVYVSRGGNVRNPFLQGQRQKVSPESFADSVSEKCGESNASDDFLQKVIEKTNSQTLIVGFTNED